MKEVFDKILERLDEKIVENTNEDMTYKIPYFGLDIAKEIVQEVEKEYKGGWIPCSERLPDVETDVLLSLRSLDIYTGFRANTEGCFYVEGEGYVECENVIAWQPLPSPFQEIEVNNHDD